MIQPSLEEVMGHIMPQGEFGLITPSIHQFNLNYLYNIHKLPTLNLNSMETYNTNRHIDRQTDNINALLMYNYYSTFSIHLVSS